MTEKLTDPTLPPGEIIEEFEDGGALRNDGMRLMPAGDNPWYVLATVYGEQERTSSVKIDRVLHFRNRRIWNGWMCQGMPADQRRALAEQMGLSVEDLRELADAERAKLNLAMETLRARCPEAALPEPPGAEIVLSEIHFSNPVVLEKCVFRGAAIFNSSTFSGFANFRSSTFSRGAHFSSSTFSRGADFGSSTFSGDAEFGSSTFSGVAHFESSTFDGDAFFESSTFNCNAHFRSSTFSGDAEFESSTFSSIADFSDGAFKSFTAFEAAHFEGEVPQFYQRQMHQNTTFSTRAKDAMLWPAITANNAKRSKDAYVRLRVIMNELQKPDDEHFFFRQEMRCKQVDEGPPDSWIIRGYGIVSGYGYSVTRPLVGLGATIAVGWPFIASYLKHGLGRAGSAPIAEGLGISFANTFPFLGFTRKMHPDFFQSSPAWLDALSGVQSIAGVALLFFLGLGLRNRFRLK